MKILKQVGAALSILSQNGYYAYVVGGCVRDSLLFNIPHDWDITTSALPSQIIACFLEYKVIETGLKYGTVTVIIDKIPIEITTYRIDGEYKDNRRPENVLFTDNLKDDLSRRDFTMNAIAYNNEIIDFFGGVLDIENKIIRTVGESDERFSEDALRILRAIRFSSQLSFSIEKETKKSIIKNRALLKNISVERINIELRKLLLGENFFSVLNEYKEVIFEIIPELREINKNLENSENDIIIRLSLLLWDLNSFNILKNLKFDNKTIDMVSKIIENKDTKIIQDRIELKKLLNKLSEKILRKLMKINKLKESLLDDIIKSGECYSLKQLEMTGDDVREHGIEGVKIGEILNEILTLVIEEKLQNNKDACNNYIKNEYK